MTRRRYTNKQIIAAVKAARGLVFLAAKNLHCDPATIHHRAVGYYFNFKDPRADKRLFGKARHHSRSDHYPKFGAFDR